MRDHAGFVRLQRDGADWFAVRTKGDVVSDRWRVHPADAAALDRALTIVEEAEAS